MSDNQITPPVEPTEGGRYYTQTIVEVVDGGRRRKMLGAVLVVLLAALVGVGFLAANALKPAGSPKKGQTPDGVTWIRSIYAWGKNSSTLINSPVDAAFAPDGTVWTVSGKTTLVGFNPNGSVRRVIELKRGSGDGMVNSLEGMDIAPNGEIYVCDYGNNKIVVFDEQGRILREIGIQLPVDLAVNGDRIAVAAANGVAVIDSQGKAIAQWGSQGTQPDQFDLPHGISWGGDGNIYVSDTNNKRIKAYTASGKLLWIYPKNQVHATRGALKDKDVNNPSGLQLPSGMTNDASGRVVLVDPFEFAAIPVVPAKKGIGDHWGDYGRRDGLFAYPTGIDYDSTRDEYVIADTANNRLQIVKLPGSGGNVAAASLRSALDQPIWLGLLPVGLLALAVVVSRKQAKGAKKVAEA